MTINIFRSINVADVFSPDVYFVKSFQGMSIGEKYQVAYMAEIPPIVDDQHIYFGIQNWVNNCVNNAETVNAKLKSILEKVIKNPEVVKFVKTMDFMKCRDLLSDFLKSWQLLKSFPQFDTAKKIKNITKPFCDFINVRNIFTHGSIYMLQPEKIILIKYVESNAVKFCQVNKEILLSYNMAYRIFMTFLSFVERLFDKAEENQIELVLQQYNGLIAQSKVKK